MNKNLRALIGTMLILLIMLGAALWTMRSLHPLSAEAQESVSQQVVLASPTQKPGGPSYPITQVMNGIKIEVLAAQPEGDFYGADICFDFPNNNPEWSLGGPDNLMLSNGVEDIGVYSIHLMGKLKTDSQGQYVGRCDHVKFPTSSGTKLENLQIIVKRLVTNIPEAPDCSQAQARLDAAKSGIVIRCANGDQIGGFEIVSKPATMDQKHASDLVLDAFRDTVSGPWTFDIGTP